MSASVSPAAPRGARSKTAAGPTLAASKVEQQTGLRRLPARRRWGLGLTYATLILWIVVSLAPVVWAVLQSFKKPPDIFAIPPKWLFSPTLENFRNLFSQTGSAFLRYLLDSLVVTIGTVVVTLAVSLPAAYALAFLPLRHRFWPVVLLLAAMLPPIVLLVPLFLFWQDLHLIDSLLALVLTYSALNAPFSVWLLRGFMIQVPSALLDAGRIDGAGEVRLLSTIVMPVIRSGVASACVFIVIFAWNELLFSSILTTTNRTAASGIVATLITDRAMDWGTLYAAATLVVAPILLFTFGVRKHFVRGFTMGAVKG